ncbi:MAG: fimbrillin family protein, partial [Prevotellaceae bacterium]|nr:fimbrillin family protein [Prevotellaceae bacterium]
QTGSYKYESILLPTSLNGNHEVVFTVGGNEYTWELAGQYHTISSYPYSDYGWCDIGTNYLHLVSNGGEGYHQCFQNIQLQGRILLNGTICLYHPVQHKSVDILRITVRPAKGIAGRIPSFQGTYGQYGQFVGQEIILV